MKEYFIWLAKVVTILVLIIVIIPATIAGMIAASKQGHDEGEAGKPRHAVAVVEMRGLIDDSKEVIDELYKQVRNDDVAGIVLRVDSPGGAVAPSQDVYAAVMRLKDKKPIVASMGTLAASGGLYAAVAASRVYAQPGTMTGSIGVVLQVPNFSGVMQKVGVDVLTIKSGQLKDAGNMFRPMTNEERAFLEETSNSVHQQFIRDVAKARNLSVEQVKTFADGRLLMGEQAKELKLVDEFGTVYDAARAVFDLRGAPLTQDQVPTLLYPDERFKEFRKLFNAILSIPKMLSQTTELRYQMP